MEHRARRPRADYVEEELRKSAGSAHAEAEGQPGLRRVIGARKAATRRLHAEIERRKSAGHRTLDGQRTVASIGPRQVGDVGPTSRADSPAACIAPFIE